MVFSTRRWQVGTIVARVRASASIGAAGLDTAERATWKLEVLRIADGVDAGLIGNDEAVAAFTRIAEDLDGGSRGSFGPVLRT